MSAISDMNDDLFNVRNWYFRNHLLLNPTKTKLRVFGNSKLLPRLQDFSVSLLGKGIFPTQTAKDLGVILICHTMNIYSTPFLLVCLAWGKQIALNTHLITGSS